MAKHERKVPPLPLEKIRELLVSVTGGDCYAEGVLFPDDEDREAFKWLMETLNKVKANVDKAQRMTLFLRRVILNGYIDHIFMHECTKALDDDEKLRATVAHLTNLLSQK